MLPSGEWVFIVNQINNTIDDNHFFTVITILLIILCFKCQRDIVNFVFKNLSMSRDSRLTRMSMYSYCTLFVQYYGSSGFICNCFNFRSY